MRKWELVPVAVVLVASAALGMWTTTEVLGEPASLVDAAPLLPLYLGLFLFASLVWWVVLAAVFDSIIMTLEDLWGLVR